MADISKKTVLILLILVIVSSIISTWAFVSSVNSPQKLVVVTPKKTVGSGELSLEIKEPPQPSTTDAQVQLEITQPPNTTKGG